MGENVSRDTSKQQRLEWEPRPGASFNNRRRGSAQGNERARSPYLVSIQGINNLREGQTAIRGANKHRDKLSGCCERGISKAVILKERQACI